MIPRKHYFFVHVYVSVPEKTDHSVQILDIEISVPHCSALFTLHNDEVRIAMDACSFPSNTRPGMGTQEIETGLICEKG